MHNYGPSGIQNFSDQIGYKVQLFIQCRKLKDVDGLGQGYSDPICILYHKVDPKQDNWQLFGRTEEMKDNLNPDFEKSFLINYYFEKHQPLRFEILDGDNSGGKLELIGATETTLGSIMGSKNQTYIQDLVLQGSQNSRGKIIVRGDSVKESNWEVTIKMGARNLPSTAKLCCSDNNPFFEIYRGSAQDKSQFYKVYDSDSAVNTTNPIFQPFKLTGQQLCNSDKNLPIQFKFINKSGTQHNYLGSCTVTANELIDRKEFELKNSRTNAPAGVIQLHQFSLVEKPTFVDYLRSGWQINLQVAIDFTASNGESSQPHSLHFLGGFNQYEQAIQSVGSILEVYDNDRSFPVFGFGGIPRFMGINEVSHCFPLNGNFQNPEVYAAQGILHAYRQNLPMISLSGPTYFSYVLHQITEIVKMKLNEPLYNILLIITDGEIHDMEASRDQIVAASHLPLSIIIVGVGNEKFKLMKQLDSDDALLRDSKGNLAIRDIVQFVKFKKYVEQGPQRLAEEVLQEVPDQLVSYMMAKGIRPNPVEFAQH